MRSGAYERPSLSREANGLQPRFRAGGHQAHGVAPVQAGATPIHPPVAPCLGTDRRAFFSPMMTILDELRWRGLVADCTDIDGLVRRIALGPVTFYAGFDPTADSLHVGNHFDVRGRLCSQPDR